MADEGLGRSGLMGTAVMLALLATSAYAQQTRDPDAFLNRQRAIEAELVQRYDSEVGDAGRTVFDWGGWANFHLMIFDDGVKRSRTFRRHDLRLWGRLTIDDGAHQIYARGRFSFLDFDPGDSYDGNDDDVNGPNLERGFYRFDLAKALRADGHTPRDYNVLITVGRDLVRFGDGLTLSTTLDHVALRGITPDFDVRLLAGKTVGSSEDFDRSRVTTRTRRNFLGGELRYTTPERHEPYIYVLWQRDRNREAIPVLLRSFDYDSFYFGIGSTGELGRGWRYATELVYETGTNYGHRALFSRQDIEAWAFRVELEHLFSGDHRGRASVEYLFGSGDSDRFASPTNTIGGNVGDRSDNGFVAFGYRDTGLSFAPRVANLHMGRIGASYYPWPGDAELGRLELGTDWYIFHKHHRDGAVSDPTADLRSGYLGWEMDYFLNWRVTADFAWTARLGAFFPGRAFSDRATRLFALVGLTWSF